MFWRCFFLIPTYLCIYLIYLLGEEASLVIISYDETYNHAIVKYKDKYIEPQIYNKYYAKPTKILFEIDYKTILFITTNNYTKGLTK